MSQVEIIEASFIEYLVDYAVLHKKTFGSIPIDFLAVGPLTIVFL